MYVKLFAGVTRTRATSRPTRPTRPMRPARPCDVGCNARCGAQHLRAVHAAKGKEGSPPIASWRARRGSYAAFGQAAWELGRTSYGLCGHPSHLSTTVRSDDTCWRKALAGLAIGAFAFAHRCCYHADAWRGVSIRRVETRGRRHVGRPRQASAATAGERARRPTRLGLPAPSCSPLQTVRAE